MDYGFMEIQNQKWKPMLRIQKRNQIVRVFRVKEFQALIDNVDVRDESTFTSSRDIPNLTKSGILTEDVQAWIRFLLYSGTRFAEAVYIHDKPELYEGRGIINLPYYNGKEKRSIQARTIFLSYKGRKILDDFFKARMLPTATNDEVTQTLTSLSTIMHKAGERIGLPEITLTTYRRTWKRDDQGKLVYDVDPVTHKKRKVMLADTPKEYTTNGCVVRSLRKTWESWTFNELGEDNRMASKITLSQGHKDKTSLNFYLNLGYDADDMTDIKGEVDGYGVVGELHE